MSERKYQKAPVSEVIFGVTLKKRALPLEKLFDFREILKEDYPKVEVGPILTNESLKEFKLINEIDEEKSGPFMLRLRSSDKKWLVQLQGNKLYLNWIRHDIEEVGHYPGYTEIAEKYFGLVSKLIELSGIDLAKDVLYYDLTYHDRVEWGKHIKSISELNTIFNFMPPQIDTSEGLNNIFSKYTYAEKRIGGYGILSLNSNTSITNVQLLRVENILRGFGPSFTLESWFSNCHELQVSHFEKLFKTEILERWK